MSLGFLLEDALGMSLSICISKCVACHHFARTPKIVFNTFLKLYDTHKKLCCTHSSNYIAHTPIICVICTPGMMLYVLLKWCCTHSYIDAACIPKIILHPALYSVACTPKFTLHARLTYCCMHP